MVLHLRRDDGIRLQLRSAYAVHRQSLDDRIARPAEGDKKRDARDDQCRGRPRDRPCQVPSRTTEVSASVTKTTCLGTASLRSIDDGAPVGIDGSKALSVRPVTDA